MEALKTGHGTVEIEYYRCEDGRKYRRYGSGMGGDLS